MKTKITLVLAALVLVGGSISYYLYTSRTSEGISEEPTLVTVTEFPTIRNQDVVYPEAEGPNGLIAEPNVQTTDGKWIQLKLLKRLPQVGFYQYGSGLYVYDRYLYTFTHIPNGDAASFENVQSSYDHDAYSKDKNNVYCNGRVVDDADAATFIMIPDWHESKAGFTSIADFDTWKYRIDDSSSYHYQDKNWLYGGNTCETIVRLKR